MARKHRRRTRKRNKKGGFVEWDQKCQKKLAKAFKDGKILVLM